MPLIFECQTDTSLPLDATGLTPATLRGKGTKEIARQSILWGREWVELGQVFRVTGSLDDDLTLRWQGNLKSVHAIGAGMQSGVVIIESEAGRHVGCQMSGGSIVAQSSVSDYAGAEMRGGVIRIGGDAGDGVGGSYPGAKTGMTGGTLLIDGDAGRGLGQRMRRGVIAVGGDVGRLCGWNMLAGTLVVFGKADCEYGAGMKRGTIVFVHPDQPAPLPTFTRGGQIESPLFSLLGSWLEQHDFSPTPSWFRKRFRMYHGDWLQGGRGEIFFA